MSERQRRLDAAKRETLATIADLLLPRTARMPSAGDVDLADAPLDRLLASRPDLFDAMTRILNTAPDQDAASLVEHLELHDRNSLDILLQTVFGAYYMQPSVRHRLGYPGQEALALPRAGFGAEDLLTEMMKSPKRFRPVPEKKGIRQSDGSLKRTRTAPEHREQGDVPMKLQHHPARHVGNPLADPLRDYGASERKVLSVHEFDKAQAEIASWPGYAPTPLTALPGLAKETGIGGLFYKDEGKRFGLKSFKALGGAYAVLRVLQNHLSEQHGEAGVTAADLLSGRLRDHTSAVTVAAATDGNHGRSVAWGAQIFGCRCNIYLHSHVSDSREREIAKYDADIIRVPGNYDDSVRQCAEDAAANGWVLVADTNAGGGDDYAPRLVMQGYTVMAQEIIDQTSGSPPSHVFVQGGVGGLAASVCGHLWERLGDKRPRTVVVEPLKADCIFRSVAAGRPTPVPGDTESFMACLAAGEISPLAWQVLKNAADHIISLPDEAAADAMRLLATGVAGDPPVVSGESGCATIAGLIAASGDETLRERLSLTGRSVVVAIGSEGATDEETYRRVVGKASSDIERPVS